MGKLSKLTVLLFAVMLTFVSTSTVHSGKAPNIIFPGLEDENPSSYISDSQLIAFCLYGSGEHVSNPARNFPSPNSKNHSYGSLGTSYSLEVKIQNSASQYLLHSKEIIRSLTVRDIIFPFHYFL